MEINLFFEGVDSYNGYQTRLFQKICAEVDIHRCIYTSKTHDDKDHITNPAFKEIVYNICERNQYDEYYNLNDCIPLDQEILEKMQPYESTATKMLVRNMEQDIYTYDESKRLYLKHLRFWNDIFVKEKINTVFQNCIPHHTHDYIIYALAHIYHCRYFVCQATSIWNYWICARDFNKNDEVLEDYYALKKSNEVIQLTPDIEHYYKSLLIENREMDNKLLNAGKSKEEAIHYQKNISMNYLRFFSFLLRNKHKVKIMLLNGILLGNKEILISNSNNIKQDYIYYRRGRLKKKSLKNISYYNRYATKKIPITPFVIYFLHYQPEATTLPHAGVFVEQEIGIALLAHVLKKRGIRLLVKEHYVQPYRMKSFYDDIRNIDNVTLVHSLCDSKEIIKDCIATATCNGTIIQESIFNGKPVFALGNGVFCDAPGVFRTRTEDQINYALDSILKSDFSISQKDVQAYLKAFEMNSTHTYVYSNRVNENLLTIEDSIENMKNIVVKKIGAYADKSYKK